MPCVRARFGACAATSREVQGHESVFFLSAFSSPVLSLFAQSLSAHFPSHATASATEVPSYSCTLHVRPHPVLSLFRHRKSLFAQPSTGFVRFSLFSVPIARVTVAVLCYPLLSLTLSFSLSLSFAVLLFTQKNLVFSLCLSRHEISTSRSHTPATFYTPHNETPSPHIHTTSSPPSPHT